MSVPDPASDNLLYHYTSEAGLRGILESDRIWATDVRFLNDDTEFQRAFNDKYLQIVIEAFRTSMRKDIDSEAARIINGMLSARNHAPILELIEKSKETNDTFVCSFSRPQDGGFDPGDRLSQWRGYSHGSQGFSLGFDPESLEKQIAMDGPTMKRSVMQCIYEDTGPDARLFEETGRDAGLRFNDLWLSGEAVPDSFQTLNPDATAGYIKANYYFLKALSKATAEFFTHGARIKHIGFREECEWRIVVQASHEALLRSATLRSRNGPFGKTPYIEVPLGLSKKDPSPLRRIVVGPGKNKDKDDLKEWVERLLKTGGIPVRRGRFSDGVEVSLSTIPYRVA